MIFYFTGTGNSLQVAQSLSTGSDDRLVFIPKAMDFKEYEYSIGREEAVGFVFPVYAWAPPKIVLDFIQQLILKESPAYLYAVCTCGDEAGKAVDIVRRHLEKRGLHLDSGFSIGMPNNYIVMFDVDPPEVEQQKLQRAEQRLREIQNQVSSRKPTWQVEEGSLPGLKSRVVNPLFVAFATSTKPFYAEDTCVRCGKCVSVCPVHTIHQEKEKTGLSKPAWGKQCTMCLACIHRCPVGAIQYGNKTQNKGRYYNKTVGQ